MEYFLFFEVAELPALVIAAAARVYYHYLLAGSC
jgi:hypothetical protein